MTEWGIMKQPHHTHIKLKAKNEKIKFENE